MLESYDYYSNFDIMPYQYDDKHQTIGDEHEWTITLVRLLNNLKNILLIPVSIFEE